jgi:hemerythrin
MMIVEWHDKFSIGIPLIDNQHKALVLITNKLYNAGSSDEQFAETIKEAVAYVKFHFSVEEQIQARTAYPGYEEHKKLHAEFIREILNHVVAFKEGKKFVPHQFVHFLKDWVLSHIALVDKKMGDYLTGLQRSGKLGDITLKRKT